MSLESSSNLYECNSLLDKGRIIIICIFFSDDVIIQIGQFYRSHRPMVNDCMAEEARSQTKIASARWYSLSSGICADAESVSLKKSSHSHTKHPNHHSSWLMCLNSWWNRFNLPENVLNGCQKYSRFHCQFIVSLNFFRNTYSQLFDTALSEVCEILEDLIPNTLTKKSMQTFALLPTTLHHVKQQFAIPKCISEIQ